MGFRLRRFRLTVGYMTPPDDCHAFQSRDLPLLPMSSDRHIVDLVTVNLANVGALALSLSEVEQWVRVAGCLLAAVYTSLKIFETLKALKK